MTIPTRYASRMRISWSQQAYLLSQSFKKYLPKHNPKLSSHWTWTWKSIYGVALSANIISLLLCVLMHIVSAGGSWYTPAYNHEGTASESQSKGACNWLVCFTNRHKASTVHLHMKYVLLVMSCVHLRSAMSVRNCCTAQQQHLWSLHLLSSFRIMPWIDVLPKLQPYSEGQGKKLNIAFGHTAYVTIEALLHRFTTSTGDSLNGRDILIQDWYASECQNPVCPTLLFPQNPTLATQTRKLCKAK